ncbi:serine/threonine-protein kinase SMG1 isoform X2 [Parasteatoda tepidariorum]|uniref:serine/threonine-protein kinase SMG1 isoform X2 n=1 Tax=Parasteatoda tepidariorum TaxID=114398 RepID=UPI001C71827E|nr:serine/threonine-protein kinase SMG1 isoform X2 [Parasteatoda tepidariorum]
MSQRSTFSRTKEPRREKIIRIRRDDDEKLPGDETPSRRSSSERTNATNTSVCTRYKDTYGEKSRSNSRDGLVFRRQERGKLHPPFSKSGEASPGRLSHPDTIRNEYSSRSSYGSHYNRSMNSRDRDYIPKRSGYLDNNHIIDEHRLKNYLNRLLRDEDRERQASMIRQLRATFEHPENLKVILALKEDIISALEDFIQPGLNAELKYELVLMIGTFCAVLGSKAKSLLDSLFTVINNAKSEEIKIIILKSILEALKIDGEKRNLSEHVASIMGKLQSSLEIADMPEIFIAIMNVVTEISISYSNVFSKHFSDTVDILIGWHIDATQQQSVIEFTSNTLIGFQHFWISDINFTFTLLGQFLEDMESYALGLPKKKPQTKKSVLYLKEFAQSKLNFCGTADSHAGTSVENIAKIKSLVKVLITVLKSIHGCVTIEENGPITYAFVVEMLRNFLKYIMVTVEFCYYSDLMTSANECLLLLITMAQLHTKDALEELMAYIHLVQARNARLQNEGHLKSVLSMLICFVKTIGTHLPIKFVTTMFDKSSLTRQLRLSPSQQIQKLLMELYYAILAVKSVQIVEEFYRSIMLDIVNAQDILFSDLSVNNQKAKQEEISLLLSVCALVEIGNVKHSLIRMFALKPSFFELMTNHLNPTQQELSKRFPELQCAILYILYSHCRRHSHFVNSSAVVNPNAAVSGSPMSTSGHNSPIMTDVPPPSPTTGNLEKVIQVLVDLLEGTYHCSDSRLLAARWTLEILDNVQQHLSRLVQSDPFDSLIRATLNAAFTSSVALCKVCCRSLHMCLKNAASLLPDSILQKTYELCLLRMSSYDTELQELFVSLFSFLPLDIVLMGNSVNFSKNVYLNNKEDVPKFQISTVDVWKALRGYMNKSSPGNFHSHHFKVITNFILQRKEPQENKWLLRLYFSCPPPDRQNSVDSLMTSLINVSSAVLWFWAIWEVAQFCVVSKLRTPLGKPQETFMAIEAALKSVVKPSKTQDNFQSESKHTTLKQIHLLLSLLEQLEKLMYNAYEGTASSLPSPPKNVRTFFRTNKSTCHEWLNRIRSTATLVAFNAGCPAAAVRHGYEYLQEIKNSGNSQVVEVENTLYTIVKALIQLRCPEAVLGLYIWCKENLNKKYAWIKASVDWAAGRSENAVEEFITLLHSKEKSLSKHDDDVKSLKETDLQSSDSEGIFGEKLNMNEVVNKRPTDVYLHSFLMSQIVDCYTNVQNWSEAVKWSESLDSLKVYLNGMNSQNSSYQNNLSFLRCLSSFEKNQPMCNMKDASSLLNSLVMNSDNNSSWFMSELLNKAQRSIMTCAINTLIKGKTSEYMKESCEKLNEAKESLFKLMKVSLLNWPLHLDVKHASLYLSASQQSKKVPSLLLREGMKLDLSDSVLGFIHEWENIWSHVRQSTFPNQGHSFDLLMITAKSARKQQNFKMCSKLLLRNLVHFGINMQTVDLKEDSSINSLLCLSKKSLKWDLNDKLLRIQRETAKLLHCVGESDKCYDLMISTIDACFRHLRETTESSSDVEQLSDLNSRSLLNLVKYLQHDSKTAQDDVKNLPSYSKLHETVIDIKNSNMSSLGNDVFKNLKQENVVSDVDYLSVLLLQLSVQQCPSLAKSWYSFASWCYAHGRKVVNSACTGSLNMLPEEKYKIISLIPNAYKEDIDNLLNIITSLLSTSSGEWDNQEVDYTESGAEEVRWQLMTCCPFLLKLDNHEEVIESLLEMWKVLVSRAYSYYRIAAASYLQYLQLNGKASIKEKTEDDNVTATLRLLRLVVKHATELRDILEEGLAETPTAPWRGIIPQLFSRLNHPETYVRQSISDLLCRVAHASPHLIVFPAVVGSLTLKVGPQLQDETAGLFGAYFSDTAEEVSGSQVEESQLSVHETLDEDSEEDRQTTAVMQNCFTALVETLEGQDERTISEARNLIHELHRITLLWDELWLGTLSMHQSEVNRRFSNLDKEIGKVMGNTYLNKEEKKEIIKEKHNVYVKPTLFLLEQLQAITSQPAETPHEQWFQKTFGKQIEETINKLRNPEDPSRPQNSWSEFKNLHQLLQQKVHQQSRSHLNMEQISPILASLKSTVIPMPGINKQFGGVTVQSVHNVVSVLPTKTKPKKLAFIGSDGQRYTYLFKGLEDLHLDERIMQFLSIVNNMFAKNKRHGKHYARHYSVTPLGPRSGLIQWVDGASPLFGLYKRWQQREASSLKNASSNVGILRPSEIFYNKLTPLLKEKNVSLDNRKEWPLSVLLDVLKQLMSETPDNLLAKELWCSCSSALEWWNITQTYNHSTAVMSVIGYIIGLGDRHLDNVLVDLSTGEVVHIDYNVCFEKGKNLRVPEKVPFRMTPNIRTALGLNGVEGLFRLSCEHVMKVLRKGRETLLTLLEAFVYDPLVDWTPGNEGGYTGAVYGGQQAWVTETKQTRQEMEVDIALSMFAIRVAEMKGEWLKNRDELLSAFPQLEVLLQEWKNAQHKLQSAETELQDACQEKALLEEALANPNHSLYSVPKRYDETTIVKSTVNATKEAANEKLNEYKKWHSLHCESLSAVCGSELSKRCNDISFDHTMDNLSITPVVEFLQTAGQGPLVQQCEHAESELANTLQQRQIALRNCVDLLSAYATIILQFGPGYWEQNRCFKWQQWLENLLSDFTSLKCLEVMAEFRQLYDSETSDGLQIAISLNMQFQTLINESNSKVLSILERMRLEGVEDKNTLTTFCKETKCAIMHYLGECDESSHLAFLCVFCKTFCSKSSHLMMMESAASGAGDRLVDLASWNGDWFLDELSTTCGSLNEFVQLLQDSVPENAEMKAAIQGMKAVNGVFAALEDLILQFQNIILPEAIQTALEPSVIEMVAKLDRIIARCGIPLDKLVDDLEANISNFMIPENRVADTVKKLRNEFESLMQRTEPQITGLNHGQMLLMGYNGLFTKVDSDLDHLLAFLDNFNVPLGWSKLPFFQKSLALSPAIHHPEARPVLKDIYFAQKLLAMQESFHLCYNFASSLQLSNGGDARLVTDHQLVKPVKHYTANFVRHMLLGLPSQVSGFVLCALMKCLGLDLTSDAQLQEMDLSIDDIVHRVYNKCVSEHYLDSQILPLNSLLNAFDAAWHKEDLSRRMEQYLLIGRNSQQRAQLQFARFQWLNEDLILQANIGVLQNPSSRTSIMSEIRKTVSTLVALDCIVSSAEERYLNLIGGIEQRLKWAAGANPSLSTIQEEFESAIANKTTSVTKANQVSRELVNVCNAILHFEALRTRTTEALSSDTSFMTLLNRCKETCELSESCQSQISVIEEHLISLKPLDKEGVTTDWLTSVIKKVSLSLTTCREKLEQQKSVAAACWESLHQQVTVVHDLISVHHKLMSEVRHILRNLAKNEEQILGAEFKCEGEIHGYMALYKEFSERISSIVSSLLGDSQDLDLLSCSVEEEIPILTVNAAEIYNQLIDLAGPIGDRKHGQMERIVVSKNMLSPTNETLSCYSPMRTKTPRVGTPKKQVKRDPRTGKAVQERNTYATNVWKRVKLKLDGKDPDPMKKSNISEQIDFVIKEATNMENLAVLYEGWTPWV